MKRATDLLLVFLTAPIWVPMLLIVAMLAWVAIGWPIFFVQSRPGRNAVLFRMVKLRTMTCARDQNGVFLPDAARLTRFGTWLRSTSLDELPELWNVLKGEMSLVGPRPLLPQYLPLYTKEQARRHDVRPGITGWAQVNGRNAITWEEKFALDLWYVDNQSFRLDLRILVMTLYTVLRRTGTTHEGHATMSAFEGQKPSVDTSLGEE